VSTGDHLSTAVETVEELSVAPAEFAPGLLGLGRDEPRGSLAEGPQDVRLRVGWSPGGEGVPTVFSVSFVFHTSGSASARKSFSTAPSPADAGDDTGSDRRAAFILTGGLHPGMDRVEHGVSVESDGGLDESFVDSLGLEGRREVVEFLTVLVLVVVLAAATSVVLVPA